MDRMLDVDSYKSGHFLQYPPETEALFGYLESRGGQYKDTLFYGLRPILEQLAVPTTMDQVEYAAKFMKMHGEPFPYDGWKHIVEKHGGHLPIRIRAVEEGTVIPVRNALLTVETLDERVPWIMGWIETQLMRLWYPITVATRSLVCKRVIWEFLQKTSNDPAGEIGFKLHDFGSRGVSSRESAGIGGSAHLVNFLGTDTIEGALYAKAHYMVDEGDPVGFSIPASEHAPITAWGRDREKLAYINMVENNTDHDLLACVSDSYDIYNAVENLWCDELLQLVKDSGKCIVIRPDSGDPVEVNLKLARIIERKIGCEKNLKGYKVFPSCFRLIQGDGNDDEESIRRILAAFEQNGFSASNIAFGMGGGLLQKLDRDTQKFAFKASAVKIDGKWNDVWKDPVTDPGKSSKRGRLDLVKTGMGGAYETWRLEENQKKAVGSEMSTVFENGLIDTTREFNDIRQLANAEFAQ